MEFGKSIFAWVFFMITSAGPSVGIADGVGTTVGVGRGVEVGVAVGIFMGVGVATGVGVGGREGLGDLVGEGVGSRGLRAVMVGTIVGADGDVSGLEVPPQENISVEASAAMPNMSLQSGLLTTLYREMEMSFRI